MKTLLLLALPLLAIAPLALGQAQSAPLVYAETDPFPDMFQSLEAATPDNREGLGSVQRRMDRVIDDQVSAWKSAGYRVTLEADEKLDSATEDFAEKLRLLTLASPEVWESSKHDAEMALREVRSAYLSIIANPTREW